MPLPMVHLSVAISLEKDMKLDKPASFYLGTISPDAIHMRAGTVKEDKSRTHHIGENREKTMENVRNVLRQAEIMEDKSLKEFTIGYCTHILTDVIWTDTVWRDYVNKLAEADIEVKDKSLYYRETDCIDFKLYRESAWRDNIWRQLVKTTSPDYFDILTSCEIEKWKNRVLTWFDDESKDPKIVPQFITENIITKFITEATEFVLIEINKHGI